MRSLTVCKELQLRMLIDPPKFIRPMKDSYIPITHSCECYDCNFAYKSTLRCCFGNDESIYEDFWIGSILARDLIRKYSRPRVSWGKCLI